MSSGLLSVVLPTRNRPDRLERAARSILAQEWPELELVVVDDASTDSTPEVTERLAKDPRVRIVRKDASTGPSAARNRGVAAARGTFLGFCDDDDAWLPGAAATLIGHLEADRDLAAVSSWHRVVHESTGRTVVFRSPAMATPQELYWFNTIALPFGVIRRERLGEGPVFDERLPTCEDWDVWLRCSLHRPIPLVPLVLYEYHQHGDARVTDQRLGGWQAFLDKHADAMTPACRIYHRSIIGDLTGGRERMVGELRAAARTRPAPTALAATVLAAGYVASSAGRRRGDPGLSARVTTAIVRGRRRLTQSGGR